jgi:hypothetical protein
MRFNSTTNETPHQALKSTGSLQKCERALSGARGTGAAWLSSARGVNCSVKSGNERNPRRALHVSHETAVVKTEEGGDDAKSAWPSDGLGDTRVTMAGTKGRKAARRSKSHQTRSQFGLESATRLHEAGIASNRESARHGEYVLGFCTRMPCSHPCQSVKVGPQECCRACEAKSQCRGVILGMKGESSMCQLEYLYRPIDRRPIEYMGKSSATVSVV